MDNSTLKIIKSYPARGREGQGGAGGTKTRRTFVRLVFVVSGGYLSFRAVSSQVLSAYKGLTSVFGMGTGGSP